MKTTAYIVTLWHEDSRYSFFKDAVGAKAYKRETAAQRKADALNAETNFGQNVQIGSRGFVVRSVDVQEAR